MPNDRHGHHGHDLVVTITLPVPPETVWATLARFEDVAQWGRGVSQSSLLSERGVGHRRRASSAGRAAPPCARRHRLGAAERAGYTIEGLPAIVRSATNTWTLAAHGTDTSVGTR